LGIAEEVQKTLETEGEIQWDTTEKKRSADKLFGKIQTALHGAALAVGRNVSIKTLEELLRTLVKKFGKRSRGGRLLALKSLIHERQQPGEGLIEFIAKKEQLLGERLQGTVTMDELRRLCVFGNVSEKFDAVLTREFAAGSSYEVLQKTCEEMDEQMKSRKEESDAHVRMTKGQQQSQQPSDQTTAQQIEKAVANALKRSLPYYNNKGAGKGKEKGSGSGKWNWADKGKTKGKEAGGKAKGADKGKGQGGYGPIPVAERACYRCGGKGHQRAECPSAK